MPKNRIIGMIQDRSVMIDGERIEAWRSQKIINHSPDGFNWGYGGSGPAQLSLAMCLDACRWLTGAVPNRSVRVGIEKIDDGIVRVILPVDSEEIVAITVYPKGDDREDVARELAVMVYQHFKWATVARLPQAQDFSLSIDLAAEMLQILEANAKVKS